MQRERERIKELALRGASTLVLGYPAQITMSRKAGIQVQNSLEGVQRKEKVGTNLAQRRGQLSTGGLVY